MSADFPILEFDPERRAIIEPDLCVRKVNFPDRAVACFFHEVIARVVTENNLTPVVAQRSEMGPLPIYELPVNGKRVAFFHPGIGAPFAAALVEEVIALGARVVIACGGAGSLLPDTKVGHIIVPTSAVRDEGTSYHYLPPAREVSPGQDAVKAVERILTSRNIPYLAGKTWTTDGVYRETRSKIRRRVSEGCLTVEMEAAALFAVGQFRGVEVAQILYAGDDVSSDTWDVRGWHDRSGIREVLFRVAMEACAG